MTDQNQSALKPKSLSVFLPIGYGPIDIKEVYDAVVRALNVAGINDYEILIISQPNMEDKKESDTVKAVDGLVKEDSKIVHVANPVYVGLGTQYRQAVSVATKDYMMIIPPYKHIDEASLAGLMLYIGQTEAIFTYSENPNISAEARYISKSYTALCNLLFGLGLKSYNGVSVIRRDFLKGIPIRTNDYACLVEVAVYTAKSGINYIELPYITKLNPNPERYQNIAGMLEIMGSTSSLFWRLCIKNEETAFDKSESAKQIVLSFPDGQSDLGQIYNFAANSSVQIIHQVIVQLGKSIDKYFSSPRTQVTDKSDGWSGGVQDAFNAFKVIKVLNLILTKVIGMMSAVNNVSGGIKKPRRSRKNKKPMSLSVIMPAYNEATKLSSAHERATQAIKRAGIDNYEIIIITNLTQDNTHDGTPDIATGIANTDPRVRHIHNESYVGLGFKYRQGVKQAANYYVMMIPGDGEFDEDSVVEVISHIGKADIVIPYISNQEVRPQERQVTSRMFTNLCNKLFGLDLRYYNGICIIPADYLKAVPMNCDNFAYMAEILIYLLKSGADYVEVPWKIKAVEGSKAFRSESINEVLETISTLFWKINIEGYRVNIPESR